MKENLPDFFIVGAAKSGTTSLYNYLENHPEIFLPKLKEPKYFVSSLNKLPQNGNGDYLTYELMINDFEAYKNLFLPKTKQQICGEASVDYLYYSTEVIPLIKQHIANPKIIIMLRDPVKRAFSAYNHLVRDIRETESFEKGLALEEQRVKENYEFIWHYKNAGRYHDSVKNYLEAFKNVKIIIFEEFVKSPEIIVKEIYQFLGVDSSITPNVEQKFNFTGKPKSKWLQKLLKGSPNQLSRRYLKRLLNDNTRLIIRDKLERLNISEGNSEIEQSTQKKLEKFFYEDKKKLEKLLNIKLNNWI